MKALKTLMTILCLTLFVMAAHTQYQRITNEVRFYPNELVHDIYSDEIVSGHFVMEDNGITQIVYVRVPAFTLDATGHKFTFDTRFLYHPDYDLDEVQVEYVQNVAAL